MTRASTTRRRVTRAGLALLALALAPPAFPLERLQRRFALEQGLPFSEVTGVTQDSAGFLWITAGGLFRYDGVEMRPWPGGPFRPFLRGVVAGPGGEVVTLDYDGRPYQVSGGALLPLDGPPVPAGTAMQCPGFDGAGRLWAVAGERLWGRGAGGEWEALPSSRFAGETPGCFQATSDGDLLVETSAGLWRLAPSGAAERIAVGAGIQVAARSADGTIVALVAGGVVAEIANGGRRELFRIAMRPIDLRLRGDVVWVSYDYGLVALHAGAPPEILGPGQGVSSGGPLFVDREGSLWLGTFHGLLQFPCPDTVAWGAEDGLGMAPRRLALTSPGIAVDTWPGLNLMPRGAGTRQPEQVPRTVTSAICVDAAGTLWAADTGGLLARRGGRSFRLAATGFGETYSCAGGAAGRTWLSTNRGIFLGLDDGSWPPSARPIAGQPAAVPDEARPKVLEDAAGRLWLAGGEQVCSTDAAAFAFGRGAWACDRIEGAGRIFSIAALPSGSLWAATLRSGVWRRREGRGWEPIPGSRLLPGQAVRALRPSPSGGMWVISFGTVLRVEERAASPDGWEVVERLSPWHGLMISDAEDVLEEPGGDLWITTLAGLVHVPAAVRRSSPPVPDVTLVEARVDGQAIAVDGPIVLSHRRNRIELRFSALSFRDPGLLRYEARLRPNAPWVPATGSPSFHFVDLRPGSYHAEVRASLDGLRWSAAPATLSFRVLPPFWLTPWFLALAAAAVAAAAFGLFRYRVAQSLRLERTRTRIAADLHDDIGASLSRIALQSDLLRRTERSHSAGEDRRLGEIAESARALVDSMSDIVWSIDPRRDDLASVIARVREIALDLLEPNGIALDFQTPPGADSLRLAPEQRRHLYLILKEAVHNIAKHAGCRSARIALRAEGGKLHVEVADDGRGFAAGAGGAAPPPGRGGHGLPNMRDRAAQMRGRLEVRSVPGEGTLISLEVPLRRGEA
jgi:signal transduction histidine kinase